MPFLGILQSRMVDWGVNFKSVKNSNNLPGYVLTYTYTFEPFKNCFMQKMDWKKYICERKEKFEEW